MSLYLPEQKLGSHSTEGGSSNKFILKGRQTGSMHRGHTWVFRAESHDTMMAWYEDIKALTEKTPEERNQFVRSHSRSLSRSSTRHSISSDGEGVLDDDEDDEPFSAGSQIDIPTPGSKQDAVPRRSQPGGRFPSDIQINAQRGLQANRSPSSLSSQDPQQQQIEQNDQRPQSSTATDADVIAAASMLPGTNVPGAASQYGNENQAEHFEGYGDTQKATMDEISSGAYLAQREAQHDGVNPYTSEPFQDQTHPEHQHFSQQHAYLVNPIVGVDQQQHSDPQSEGPQSHQSQHEGGVVKDPQPMLESVEDQRKTVPDARHMMDSGVKDRDVNMLAMTTGGFPKSESAYETTTQPSRNSLDSVATTEVSFAPRPAETARPAGDRTESSATISNLHVPGEYPKGGRAPT